MCVPDRTFATESAFGAHEAHKRSARSLLGTDSRYRAVVFDLFSALLDAGALWSEVTGSAELGARWREESSRAAYSAGSYRPFVETVVEAARVAGVPPERAADLLRGMSGGLAPWPEARD